MEIKRMEPDDYQVAMIWFKAWTGTDLPLDVLSEFGFMAFKDEKPIAASFFFPVLGCKMAIIGWPVSDPHVDKETRGVALDFLMCEIEDFASGLGYSYLTTYSSTKSVEKRFLGHNYSYADMGVNQLYKRIGD